MSLTQEDYDDIAMGVVTRLPAETHAVLLFVTQPEGQGASLTMRATVPPDTAHDVLEAALQSYAKAKHLGVIEVSEARRQ